MQNTIAIKSGKTGGDKGTPGGTLPLAMAGKGSPVRVFSIRGRDDTRRFLAELGFVEGCEVNVVSEMGGSLIVEVKGARIALDRQMALRVMVA